MATRKIYILQSLLDQIAPAGYIKLITDETKQIVQDEWQPAAGDNASTVIPVYSVDGDALVQIELWFEMEGEDPEIIKRYKERKTILIGRLIHYLQTTENLPNGITVSVWIPQLGGWKLRRR